MSGTTSPGKRTALYDAVGNEPKSPNSKADPLGPITKVQKGHGEKEEVLVYPGMSSSYAQGPGRELYDEGMYANDAPNAYYEDREINGVRLPS